MTTPEQLANQIRTQLNDVSIKLAELSNMGFSTQVECNSDTYNLIAVKQVEIKL